MNERLNRIEKRLSKLEKIFNAERTIKLELDGKKVARGIIRDLRTTIDDTASEGEEKS